MTVAVCIDDNGGMLFNNRRVSRDEAVLRDLAKNAGDKAIRINEFSVQLFKQASINYSESKYFLETAGKDDICFAENVGLSQDINKIDRLIVYCWNRRYPSDFKLDADLSMFSLTESYELTGKSHDKITVNVYEKINAK